VFAKEMNDWKIDLNSTDGSQQYTVSSKVVHSRSGMHAFQQPHRAPFNAACVCIIDQVVRIYPVRVRHAACLYFSTLGLLASGLEECCQSFLYIPQLGQVITEDQAMKWDHGFGASHVGVLSWRKGGLALLPDDWEISGC
jgi:hypothetical protein